MSDRKAVKKVENGILYSDGTIRIDNVRLSYEHIFKPWCKNPAKEKPRYSATLILPKKTHKAARDLIVSEINRLLTEKNGGEKIKADAKFLRDGHDADGDPIKKEYAGAWTVSAAEKEDNPPVIIYKGNRRLGPNESRLIWSGCWVSVLILPWWQDNENGKRVNANLKVVRFVREDEAFGEGRLSDDDIDDTFSDFDDDDDSGMDDDDEDERPAKKGSSKPSRKVADDDDDDEPPRKPAKRRPVADDDDDDL